MSTVKAVGCVMMALVILLPGASMAQSVQAPPTVGGAKTGEAACFQKAGVPDSVWEQVHSIRQNAHQQAATICQNASLTPDQQRQQVKQTHALAKRQIDALLTPQQLEGVKMCREERRMERTGGSKGGGKGGGHGDVCAKAKTK